jgi:hypothetical protein
MTPNGDEKESPMRTRRKLTLTSFALLGLVLAIVPEVLAVVGRPLTPMSYAGVARRTVRRSAYYGGYYYP